MPAPRPLCLPAAVVIGRNEGARLSACLASLSGRADPLVYVDSGSTDDSVARAQAVGADVVTLDMTLPFSAARARNAGLARARAMGASDLVQFVDGDCIVEAGWLATGVQALAADPGLACAAGRRAEIAPGRSIYNLACDVEWDTPVGPALAVGGDMLARIDALAQVGGFDPTLIAGEEPELCLRLRRAGWRIARLDAPMTRHDAAMDRFGQWWRRMRRGGHAFAEVSWRHRTDAGAFWQAETRRALVWGAGLPAAVVAAGVVHPVGWALALAWPAQWLRLARRDTSGRPRRLGRAGLTVLGKSAETLGIMEYHLRRLAGRRRDRLIEYK
ncbi:glycosyltransferase family 2 protein [Paracoccus luteus]|uniref:glycosyltransferase family 2 protein n=1 Tax=Paracoccus luteus TaxID=2508543 RepID=UPI00106F28B8|nr:glycosyltransferase [Paracoccus luteus]